MEDELSTARHVQSSLRAGGRTSPTLRTINHCRPTARRVYDLIRADLVCLLLLVVDSLPSDKPPPPHPVRRRAARRSPPPHLPSPCSDLDRRPSLHLLSTCPVDAGLRIRTLTRTRTLTLTRTPTPTRTTRTARVSESSISTRRTRTSLGDPRRLDLTTAARTRMTTGAMSLR